MEDSIVERVIILMENYGLTASAFADKIDVQRSSMSHLVSGRNKPSLDFIQKILNNFSDINPAWLIMGTGPMKQLDLFDNKGGIAPIEPLPIQTEATKPSPPPIVEQVNIQPTISHSITEAPQKMPENTYSEPVEATKVEKAPIIQPEPIVAKAPIEPSPVVSSLTAPQRAKTDETITNPVIQTEKSDKNDKKVVKIVFFYSDNSFESFNPQ